MEFVHGQCCSHFNEMSKMHDRSSAGELPMSRSVGMISPGHSPAVSARPLSPGTSVCRVRLLWNS